MAGLHFFRSKNSIGQKALSAWLSCAMPRERRDHAAASSREYTLVQVAWLNSPPFTKQLVMAFIGEKKEASTAAEPQSGGKNIKSKGEKETSWGWRRATWINEATPQMNTLEIKQGWGNCKLAGKIIRSLTVHVLSMTHTLPQGNTLWSWYTPEIAHEFEIQTI